MPYDGKTPLENSTFETSCNGSRKEKYIEKFSSSVQAFEKKCGELTHRQCSVCKIVSLQAIFKDDHSCNSCAASNAWTVHGDSMLPYWIDDDGVKQFKVPKVLACLQKGEKLLIQLVSVYVPLHRWS